MGLGEFLGQAVDVVEVAIGFVFVLFLEFILVESVVVELHRRRWSRLGTWNGSSAVLLCGIVLGMSGQFGIIWHVDWDESQSIEVHRHAHLSALTILLTSLHIGSDGGMMLSRRVDPGLSAVGSSPTKHSVEAAMSRLCALGSHCLAHHRAAAGQNLEIGHRASTG